MKLLLLLPLLIATASVANAQPSQSRTAPVRAQYPVEGTEFWLVFQKNFRDWTPDSVTGDWVPATPLTMQLCISAAVATHGIVEIAGIGFRKEFAVDGGATTIVAIDTAAQVRSSGQVERLAVHVLANSPVTVSAVSSRYQTTDTYLGFPTGLLGTRYYAAGYGWLAYGFVSQLAVAATEDGTQVVITPSVPAAIATSIPPFYPPPIRQHRTLSLPAKQPITIALSKGDVYQLIANYDPAGTSDLTGTLIESNKPVALFSGHNCAYVPNERVKSCNLLAEQLPPVAAWGTRHIVVPLAQRSSAVVRVVAGYDSTLVYHNGQLCARLQAGSFYQDDSLRQAAEYTSTSPVMVMQYSKGFSNGDSIGDPMMMTITPVDQYQNGYRVATPMAGQWDHFLNISIPTDAVGTLRIDGKPVADTLFGTIGDGRYSVGTLQVPYGLHTIMASTPFGITNYGVGYGETSYDAYGSSGGFAGPEVGRGGK